MSDKPAELLLFDFLTEIFDASAPGDVVYELELHDTVWQSITKPRGVRISDSVGFLAPLPGGELEECDVDINIACYVLVEGINKKERADALQRLFDIQTEVIRLLIGDHTLGGRVCNSVVGKSVRGYEDLNAKAYAVANIPLTINPLTNY